MKLCDTLEQRWSACRAAVYGSGFAWLRGNKACVLDGVGATSGDRRACTSPRRHHCRAGTGAWPHCSWSYCEANEYLKALRQKLEQHQTDFLERVRRFQV